MVAEQERKVFTDFPQIVDEFFQKTIVNIDVIPTELIQSLDMRCVDFNITSAQQYIDFLNQEIEFWESNDAHKIFESFSNIDALHNALRSFNNAVTNARNNNSEYSITNEMKNSVNYIRGKCLYSKTKVAKFLVEKCQDKSKEFVEGFKTGLKSARNSNAPSSIDGLGGFYVALKFLKIFNEAEKFAKEDIANFQESISTANKNYEELNIRYINSFKTHEDMMQELGEKTDEHLNKMEDDRTVFFEDCGTRIKELEVLYREKLQLEAPAEHWKKLESKYIEKAKKCIIASVVTAAVIIIILAIVLICLPNIYSADAHWIEIFRNSAAITILISVAVYILRLFVKLAISSLHLSRDAKERNTLAYFYLSLIEKGAVDEKERAIILNALFSRADTGLLKGDSSPTMPTGVTEIINKLHE